MKHEELREENCAISRSSAVLGERWVWPILRQSFNGARRFEEFQRGIGLARNVLADRLNLLVSEGILVRKPDATGASRQEYRLTAKVLELGAGYTEKSLIVEVGAPIAMRVTRQIKWPLAIGTLDGASIVEIGRAHV